MWPNTCNFGLILFTTSIKSDLLPQFTLSYPASKMPKGGEWVITISVLLGIYDHNYASYDSERINDQGVFFIIGTNGEPKIFSPSISMLSCSK